MGHTIELYVLYKITEERLVEGTGKKSRLSGFHDVFQNFAILDQFKFGGELGDWFSQNLNEQQSCLPREPVVPELYLEVLIDKNNTIIQFVKGILQKIIHSFHL